MRRYPRSLVLLCLVGIACPAQAQNSAPEVRPPHQPHEIFSGIWQPPKLASIILQDPFTNATSEAPGSAETQGDAKAPPSHIGPKKHIRDNAFLVEEAYNQEPGVAQHIFNWINQWDRIPEGRTRSFAWTYTMELPLGSQTHQFSFTTQFLTAFEKLTGGPALQQGDVGDTFLNYRYQLLADDDLLWCAPRFSLILPTGDERFGLGTGQLGYQFNLPVSRYGDKFDFHFNAGLTYTPGVSIALPDGRKSLGQDIRAFNLGGSVFWKPETYLHFFVELLWLRNEELDDVGFRNGIHQVFVNPGIRYAICQFEEVEWVIGVAVPVGLTQDAPDIGVFAYMSVEHALRKIGNGE